MRNIEKLLEDGIVTVGYCYELQNDILVIEDGRDLSDEESDAIEKYAIIEDLEVFYSDDTVYLGDYFYIDRSNYFFTKQGYPISIDMIDRGDYDFQEDVLETFKNNYKNSIFERIFDKLSYDFNEEGWELIDEVIWYGYEGGEDTHPKTILEKYKKIGFDVIFILTYCDMFNVEYKILIKKRA